MYQQTVPDVQYVQSGRQYTWNGENGRRMSRRLKKQRTITKHGICEEIEKEILTGIRVSTNSASV